MTQKSRAEKYLDAGADGILITAEKEDGLEIEEFSKYYRKLSKNRPLIVVPTSYNSYTEEQLVSNGADIIIYANHLLRASYPAIVNAAKAFKKSKEVKKLTII